MTVAACAVSNTLCHCKPPPMAFSGTTTVSPGCRVARQRFPAPQTGFRANHRTIGPDYKDCFPFARPVGPPDWPRYHLALLPGRIGNGRRIEDLSRHHHVARSLRNDQDVSGPDFDVRRGVFPTIDLRRNSNGHAAEQADSRSIARCVDCALLQGDCLRFLFLAVVFRQELEVVCASLSASNHFVLRFRFQLAHLCSLQDGAIRIGIWVGNRRLAPERN